MEVVVKVTGIPLQTGLFETVMLTLTGKFGLTVINTGMLDAGLPDVQSSDEVSVTVTISPLFGIDA